jgi:hypothetical protein
MPDRGDQPSGFLGSRTELDEDHPWMEARTFCEPEKVASIVGHQHPVLIEQDPRKHVIFAPESTAIAYACRVVARGASRIDE